MSRLPIIIVFVLLASPVLAHAQSDPAPAPSPQAREQARQLFERGTLAYQQERWQACAERFEASFVLVFAPALLYNIGVCYENAAEGDSEARYFDRSARAFARYIREAGETQDLQDVRHHLAVVQERLQTLSQATPDPEPQAVPTAPVLEAAAPPVAPVAPAAVPSPVTASPVVEVAIPTHHFRFRWTAVSAGVTAASSLLSLAYGLSSRHVGDACRQSGDCSPQKIASINSTGNRRARMSNVFLGISAVALAGTGLSLSLELSHGSPERASVSWTQRF